MKIRSFLITLTFALIASAFDASAQEQVVIGGVKYTIHDVVKGETLYSLARRYGVTVDEIKGANEVLAEGLKAGQRIKIPAKVEEKAPQSVATPKVRVHKVMKGETLYSLAKAYDVSTAAIVHYNPLVAGGLKAGQVLKIPAVGVTQPKMSQHKINRLFDEHEVKQGETVYSISRMYAVPVATLLEDNASLDPTHLAIGQKVLIRKADKGDGNERQTMEQLNEYTEALNSVSNDYKYHLVTHGETLYSLSKLYGVTQEELIEWNSRAMPGRPSTMTAAKRRPRCRTTA